VASEPFAALWTRGREGSAEEIKLAAAVLLPDTKKSAALAEPMLRAARDTAPPDVQWRIDQALLTTDQILEKWDDAVVVADRIAAKYPDSERAFFAAEGALMKLNRYDEVRTRAQARLKRLAGDTAAQQTLGSVALYDGAYADALRYYSGVLERANPTANDYNEHAWVSIFAKADLDRAVENARQAVGQAPKSYAVLNTLAVVYAEQGHSSEARDALLKSIAASDKDELQPSDWYVVGRLAENYGIVDAAVEAYQKLPKPEHVGGSSYALAQARLKQLKN
jgi:tetratricopeptide (TPR) repeat protein